MAKRKKSTALFEVFPSTQASPRRSRWRFRAPGWLGRRNGDLTAPAPEPRNDNSDSVDRMRIDEETSRPSRPAVRVSVDPDDQIIRLSLTYSTAAVTCFSVLVIVGLAYVMGRHSGRGPLPLLAERTTEELQADKPHAEVMEVSREPINAPITPDVTPIKPTTRPQNWNDPRPPQTLVVDDQKRTVGLNYVIVQSYPDEKDAQAARDLLNKHGMLCTVEPAPANWSHSQWKMYSVIGIKGFDKIRNSPDFDRYVASISAVSNEFAGKSRFKRFEPVAYKWREAK